MSENCGVKFKVLDLGLSPYTERWVYLGFLAPGRTVIHVNIRQRDECIFHWSSDQNLSYSFTKPSSSQYNHTNLSLSQQILLFYSFPFLSIKFVSICNVSVLVQSNSSLSATNPSLFNVQSNSCLSATYLSLFNRILLYLQRIRPYSIKFVFICNVSFLVQSNSSLSAT